MYEVLLEELDGEVFMPLPQQIVDELGWGLDDELLWEIFETIGLIQGYNYGIFMGFLWFIGNYIYIYLLIN